MVVFLKCFNHMNPKDLLQVRRQFIIITLQGIYSTDKMLRNQEHGAAMIKVIFSIFSTLFLSVLLSGCADEPYNSSLHPNQYVILQDVPVNRSVVRIQPMEDYTSIVIASDRLFKTRSPVFTNNANRILSYVLDCIKSGTPHHISVNAYYSEAGGGLEKITSRQAENIAAFFWSHGISKKIITFHGYGSLKPISNNLFPSGTADNRRIEIHVS